MKKKKKEERRKKLKQKIQAIKFDIQKKIEKLRSGRERMCLFVT